MPPLPRCKSATPSSSSGSRICRPVVRRCQYRSLPVTSPNACKGNDQCAGALTGNPMSWQYEQRLRQLGQKTASLLNAAVY